MVLLLILHRDRRDQAEDQVVHLVQQRIAVCIVYGAAVVGDRLHFVSNVDAMLGLSFHDM